LIDELVRPTLFAFEIRNFVGMLVPTELASAAPAKAERGKLAPTLLAEMAAKVREVAAGRNVTVSALIASALTTYLAHVRSCPLVGRPLPPEAGAIELCSDFQR
jgi:hypothetical protein